MVSGDDDIDALARRNPRKRLRQARCDVQYQEVASDLIFRLDRTSLASAKTEECHEALGDCEKGVRDNFGAAEEVVKLSPDTIFGEDPNVSMTAMELAHRYVPTIFRTSVEALSLSRATQCLK
jgi:hypothetical protein